jgi:AAA15 family ATPase/GTPase
MIESLDVTNFRGFTDISLKNLSRVNILVGDNGSGKTAFLESIFLAGGLGPEIYLRTRAWRGIGDKIQLGIDRDQYEALWKELFHSLDQNTPVTASFIDSTSGKRELRVYYDATQTTFMPMDMNVRTSYESGDIHPLTFEWKTEKSEPQKALATVNSQGIIQLAQTTNLFPIVFLSANTNFSSEENAKRFSFLSRRNRQHGVIKSIKALFPIVKDMGVEIVAGSPGLYVSVDGIDEKMAVGSLSGGLTKYIAILLAIASVPGGVVLIDEIENGFYYQKYGEVWEGIIALAQDHETQLFVSSHSLECLQQAISIVAERPSLFSLLRTQRKGGKCVVKQFAGKDLQAGIEQRIDFR